MRWRRKAKPLPPKPGDWRIIHVFILWPRELQIDLSYATDGLKEWRWFEFAKIKQRYELLHYDAFECEVYNWVDREWINT